MFVSSRNNLYARGATIRRGFQCSGGATRRRRPFSFTLNGSLLTQHRREPRVLSCQWDRRCLIVVFLPGTALAYDGIAVAVTPIRKHVSQVPDAWSLMPLVERLPLHDDLRGGYSLWLGFSLRHGQQALPGFVFGPGIRFCRSGARFGLASPVRVSRQSCLAECFTKLKVTGDWRHILGRWGELQLRPRRARPSRQSVPRVSLGARLSSSGSSLPLAVAQV